MLKKAALALFGLVLASTLMAPQKAVAQVQVGVEVGTPAVVVEAAPVVVYDDAYYTSHNWDSGMHDGYTYGGGTRYQTDAKGNKQFDDKFRDGKAARAHNDHHEDKH